MTDRRTLLTEALGVDPVAFMRNARQNTVPPAAQPGYRLLARHITEKTGIAVDFTTLRAWEMADSGRVA